MDITIFLGFSLFKVFGYSFLTVLPFVMYMVIKKRVSLKFSISHSVFVIFIGYCIAQVIRGAIVLNDARNLSWIMFFFAIYIALSMVNSYSKKTNEFTDRIVLVSFISLIFYIIISLVSFVNTSATSINSYAGFFTYQDKWLIGSSSAVFILIIAYQAIYAQFNANKLKPVSVLLLLLCFFFVIFAQSRAGIIVTLAFVFCSCLSQLHMTKLKLNRKIVAALMSIISLLLVYNISAYNIYNQKGLFFAVGRMIEVISTNTGGTRYSDSSDKDRFLSFQNLLIIQPIPLVSFYLVQVGMYHVTKESIF